MVLLGMVPVLMHVPPTTSRRSTIATFRPILAPWMAARWPAGPEPMTTRSKRSTAATVRRVRAYCQGRQTPLHILAVMRPCSVRACHAGTEALAPLFDIARYAAPAGKCAAAGHSRPSAPGTSLERGCDPPELWDDLGGPRRTDETLNDVVTSGIRCDDLIDVNGMTSASVARVRLELVRVKPVQGGAPASDIRDPSGPRGLGEACFRKCLKVPDADVAVRMPDEVQRRIR